MNNNKTPLSLVSIKFNVCHSRGSLAKSLVDESSFDDRSDFAIDFRLRDLAVLLAFSNERVLKSDKAPGIRRNVSVSLIDDTDSRVLSTIILKVNIHRGELTGTYRVDFPFIYYNIVWNHSFKVVVREVASGRELGGRAFHLFDEGYGRHCFDRRISECFQSSLGGLARLGVSAFYRSFHAELPGHYAVRFRLHALFADAFANTPWRMPEMEVRIHYPDGSMDSRFGVLECEDYDMGEYQIEMPFFLKCSQRGIGYAELRCLNDPVAGFVFCTDSDEIPLAWDGEDLRCIDEYSLESVVQRYRVSINKEENDDANSTDDDLSNALMEFLDSQLGDDATEQENGESCDETEVDHSQNAPEGAASDDASDRDAEQTIMRSLSHLVGLKSVKDKLSTYEKIVKFNKMRVDNNLTVNPLPLHAMFQGSPGTGKTTVAKRMGIMLRRAGVLSRGHVVIKERATLLGPNYSNEETNTINAIEEAQGGILFIDEAYQLYQPDDPRDPGKFVIEALMTALADESRRDWMLILAGYSDEMKRMFEMNPGLRSRIPDSNIYVFDDFTESELMEIAENYLGRNNYVLSSDAHEALSKRLASDYSRRDKNFGNARHVINLIQTEILPRMAVRVVSESDINAEKLSMIQSCDIPAPVGMVQVKRPHIGFRA